MQVSLLIFLIYRPVRQGNLWNFQQQFLAGQHLALELTPLSPADINQMLDNDTASLVVEEMRHVAKEAREETPEDLFAETADLEGPVLSTEPEALGLPEVWTRK